MALLKSDLLKNALASDTMVSILKAVIPPLDKFLLRCSRGHINTAMQPVALVETRGARSGEPRQIVTLCMPTESGIVLVGSNWGRERDPAWVYNLRAHSEVKVTFRGYVGPMWARELAATEREQMWARLIEHNPQYARYQSAAQRSFPVMQLERKPPCND